MVSAKVVKAVVSIRVPEKRQMKIYKSETHMSRQSTVPKGRYIRKDVLSKGMSAYDFEGTEATI